METASFTGFLKTLFYIILFYYIFKFAMRLLLPMVLKKAVEKAEENLRNHTQPFRNGGETAQESPKQQRPQQTKKVGEYVDFEEIE
jgi:hypothetical protein